MAGITKKTLKSAAAAEKRELRKAGKTTKTRDSYQNFALNLGIGTDNALSGSTYGFNPISRNRTLLEWMHRGSWIAGQCVDTVADDTTRAGIDIVCDADPEEIQDVQDCLIRTGTWEGVRDSVAWSRLYGGAIGVIMIDGQDYEKPLDASKVGKGQYRGVVSLDRWMVEPSLSQLVEEQGPQLGLPKFYRVTSDIPGLRNKIIHYSRVIRFEGVRLPYWQRVSENLWGISVIERLYDRMVAFDSATQGAAQLAFKSYLRTIKIKDLRSVLAEGGDAEASLIMYVDMMRRFQSIEGLTMLDSEDEFEPGQAINMSGMSEALLQFGQQLSGATQIPLVRLFGQSPAGLNSTGESDLRTYYDGINQQQNRALLVPMHVIVRAAALSEGRKLPDRFQIVFRPLWQLSEEQKSEVASRDTTTILAAEERGLISQQIGLKELKQLSKVTGRFTNVTDDDIEAANDELAPRGEDALIQDREAAEHAASLENGGDDEDRNDPKNQKDNFGTGDAKIGDPDKPTHYEIVDETGAVLATAPASRVLQLKVKMQKELGKKLETRLIRTNDSLPFSQICGLDVAIETPRGSIRRGRDADGKSWESVMSADYGYIRRAPSSEGPTEWLDCYVGPVRAPDCPIHVVDGYDPLGDFDEHKVMMGFPSRAAALRCYHDAYGDGRRAGDVTTMSAAELRAWFETADMTRPIGQRNLRLAANGA